MAARATFTLTSLMPHDPISAGIVCSNRPQAFRNFLEGLFPADFLPARIHIRALLPIGSPQGVGNAVLMGLYPTTFPRKTKSVVDLPTYLDRQTREANLSGQDRVSCRVAFTWPRLYLKGWARS
jgi:hypothetical protein